MCRPTPSQIITLQLNSFLELLENVHNCMEGSKSKISKISIVSGIKNNITFECCDLKISTDNLKITSSSIEMGASKNRHRFVESFNNESDRNCLPYEEVIFIDEIGPPKEAALNEIFESVFVNVEEQYNLVPEKTSYTKLPGETDPLLVEHCLLQPELKSSIEKKLSSNVIKVSARSFLPKVVDWSSESIEHIKDIGKQKQKVKYPLSIICEFCGMKFTGKDRIYKFFQHRNRFHTNEIKYICPVCQKIYWGERELSAHMVSHLGRDHMCEVCGITFQRKNDLSRHLLTHKSKNFNCTFCSKVFVRKDHLKIHERFHTGKFPYICAKCSCGFPQKHQLKLHQKKCKES